MKKYVTMKEKFLGLCDFFIFCLTTRVQFMTMTCLTGHLEHEETEFISLEK